MSRDFPFPPKYFEHHGLRQHYVEEGTGSPVVMVHGNPTWTFYYRRLISLLSPRYRAIAIDHIGMGKSDKPGLERYDYSLACRVADLTAFLADRVPTGKLDLVVHDWGGMIGLAWAVRHPQRIRKLVILNTAGFVLEAGTRFEAIRRLAKTPWLGSWLIRRLNLFTTRTIAFGLKRRPASPKVREGFLAPYDSWNNRIAVWKFIETIPVRAGDPGYEITQEVEAGLMQFRQTPALICWGAKDFVFNDDFLEHWRTLLPEAEVLRLADAGHYVLEDAFDEVGPRIGRFLDA